MPKRSHNIPRSAVLLVVLISTAMLLVIGLPLGSTQTATVITSNTAWSKAASPINLQGNVLVKDGATLTIEAGVRVNFGNYYIRVENAAITARGTTSDKIYFEGNGELSGISFIGCTPWDEQTSTGSIIENSIINFASIGCDNARISNCDISSNVAFSGSHGEFSNNEVTGDIIMADGTICMVSNNRIDGNFETRGSPTINYNTITGTFTISGSDTDKPVITHNTIESAITQFHACPTLSYNKLFGEVSLSGESSIVTYNTIHSGLSISYTNSTISNNNFVGDVVGISVGTLFHDIYITITNNVISSYSEAGIKASNDYQSNSGSITLIIKGNVIKDCNYGMDLSGVDATIEGNLFLNNKYALIGGSTVQHNTFSGNDMGVNTYGKVNYNNFQNNKYGFSLQSPNHYLNANADATNNWWGTNDKEAIKQTLFDYKNDFNLGTITFEPFLTSPDAAAPSTSYQPLVEDSLTANPTTQPTQTAAPIQQSTTGTPWPPNSPTETFLGFDSRDAIIVLLCVVVAILAIGMILLLKGKRLTKPKK
jgi:hypothetical protein